ncbi:aminotransferase class I/II-fold pyridoxal phosphate-dependent enzyme [Desulfonauticus submarinus]
MLNSPCNSSGHVMTIQQLESLAQLALKYALYIVSDEVYEKFFYNNARHISISALPEMRKRTIIINSFSKTYAMPGWRVGYVVARKDIINQMLKVLQYTATNIAPFSQKAVIVALTLQEVLEYVNFMCQSYNQRRKAGLAALEEIDGLTVLSPQEEFILWWIFQNFAKNLKILPINCWKTSM